MDQSNLKQAFKSGIRASYFNNMGANKFTKKSLLQVSQQEQQKQVDQNTFRILRNFKAPQSDFAVIQKQGSVSQQSAGGFFTCFGRKQLKAFLKNSLFQVFQNDKLKLYFDLSVINSSVKNKKDHFELKVQTCNKSFNFYPINEMTSQEWVTALNQSISNSQGKGFKNEQICKIPQFYKRPYISNTQFEQTAATGDIVLFRSEHSAARLQQVFLNSDYDHVAIVLRNKKNQLFLYQSSSFEGVGLTEWKYMIKYEWYKSTQKMAWKKLNFKFQNHHYDIIQRFIAKTLGKGFQITFNKIFSFQSTLERKQEDQKQKTYFCSQLVARFYKQVGILDPTVSCTQYYPVTFSDSGSIKFTDHRVSLGKEHLIAF